MSTTLLLALLALPLPLARTSAPADEEPARPGDPAPLFELIDVDGANHRLRDLRGRIVVLEWTSHACPAVAAVHRARLVGDTLRAVEGDDLAWLQVDSSWFAPGSSGPIASFRRRAGLDVPYLLDPDGAVARRYGATATPHLFVVDAEGRLAYAGALDDGGGPARRNFVVEAVADLRAGRAVRTPRTRARGCSVKLGTPRDFERAEVEDDVAALQAYERAAAHAAAARAEPALAALDEALAAGHPAPWELLSDPAFAPLLRADDARRELRRRLADHPARGALTMVAPDEPGEPLVLAGTVRDARGEPIAGALLSLYHTDAAGWYAPGTTDAANPRLFGRVRTDRAGRYRVRTVMPGHYADAPRGPAHVHLDVRAAGFETLGGHRASVYFRDDPALAGASLREIVSDGCAILDPDRTAEGVRRYAHDVALTPQR